MVFDLQNPIPQSIRDTGRVKDFFQEYYGRKKFIIPYYGNFEKTSHSMLSTLHTLCTKSATYKASEKEILNYAFGSKLDVSNSFESGLIIDDQSEVSTNDKRSFVQDLKDLGIRLTDIISVTKTVQSHKFQSGNGYLRIRLINVEGVWQVFFSPIHYKLAALLYTSKGRDKMLMNVVDWDYEVLRKNKPSVCYTSEIGKDFIWKQNRNQTIFETVVHLKTKGNDESDWYGRPDILSVLEWMFVEMGQGDNSCKVSGSETVAKHIFAFKEEHKNNDVGGSNNLDDNFSQFVHTLRSVTTSSGTKPSSIGAIEYDEEAPKHYELGINRDTNWFESQMTTATNLICANMGWSSELLGTIQTSSSIGSDKMTKLFAIKNKSTIEPLQNEWEDNWAFIFEQIGILTGAESLQNYALKFERKLTSLIQDLKENGSANTINSIGSD